MSSITSDMSQTKPSESDDELPAHVTNSPGIKQLKMIQENLRAILQDMEQTEKQVQKMGEDVDELRKLNKENAVILEEIKATQKQENAEWEDLTKAVNAIAVAYMAGEYVRQRRDTAAASGNRSLPQQQQHTKHRGLRRRTGGRQ